MEALDLPTIGNAVAEGRTRGQVAHGCCLWSGSVATAAVLHCWHAGGPVGIAGGQTAESRRRAARLRPAGTLAVVAGRRRGRASTGAGRRRGRAGADQRFGLWHLLVFVITAGFGAILLVSGVDRLQDHQALVSRGLTATAVITEVYSRGSVDVRFTTAAGQEITTRVRDADSPDGLYVGGTIAVRYDPLNAAGRIESARDGNAAGTRGLLIVSGVLLLALVAFGASWWLWHAARR
jgi:hypothetical protein